MKRTLGANDNSEKEAKDLRYCFQTTILNLCHSLDNRTIKQGYIIANGIKTNLDNDSQTILQWIVDKHSVRLAQLYELCQNQNINLEKVEKLVFELTMIDVLECLIES